MECEASQPSVGRDVLVLLADWLAEALDLDVAGELCKLARVQQSSPVGIERLEQRRREASG
jgi:hypothetical protein